MQGPPGTGKTKTLQAYIKVMLAFAESQGMRSSIGQILACAQTNAATDNVLERLVTSKHSVVRIGNSKRVRPADARFSGSANLRAACIRMLSPSRHMSKMDWHPLLLLVQIREDLRQYTVTGTVNRTEKGKEVRVLRVIAVC